MTGYTPSRKCLICQLDPAHREMVDARILGDPGDLDADPPRPPMAKMSWKGVETWIKVNLARTIGYKSVGAHLDNHLRPGQKAAIEKTAREVLRQGSKRALSKQEQREARAVTSHLETAYEGSPALAAVVKAQVTATDEIDEMMAEVKATVFAVSKNVKLRAEAMTLQLMKLKKSNADGAKEISVALAHIAGPSAAEAAFVMGGAQAFGTLQRAKVATLLGKPTAGLRERGTEEKAGLKAMLKNSPPPPIPGDIDDDPADQDDLDDAEDREAMVDAVVDTPDNVRPLRPPRPDEPVETAPPAPASGSSSPVPAVEAPFAWALDGDA